MTSSLPQSPLGSPGFSDQDIEVVSPLNPPVEIEADRQAGDSNVPIAIDGDESDPPTRSPPADSLQNEVPKPQDGNQSKTKGAVANEFDLDLIDLAASSDEDIPQKDQPASSSAADGMGGQKCSRADLNEAASGVEGDAQLLEEPAFENAAKKDSLQANDAPTGSSDTTFARASESGTIGQKPLLEPCAGGRSPASDKGEAPKESAHVTTNVTEELDLSPPPVGERETVSATFDTAFVPSTVPPDKMDGPATSADANNVSGTAEDDIIAVENGGMEIDVAPIAGDFVDNGTPTDGARAETIGEFESAQNSEGSGSPTEGKDMGRAEVEAPSRMDVDSNRVELDTEKGVAESGSGMDVDTADAASSAGMNVEASAEAQVVDNGAHTDGAGAETICEFESAQNSEGSGSPTEGKDTGRAEVAAPSITDRVEPDTKKGDALESGSGMVVDTADAASSAGMNVGASAEAQVVDNGAHTDGAGAETIGEFESAQTSEASGSPTEGKDMGQAEVAAPSITDVDSNRVEPDTKKGDAEESGTGMDVDTADAASSTGMNVASLEAQVLGTDEGGSVDPSPEATAAIELPAKRRSPDQVTEQPPAKKAKESSLPLIADKESSQKRVPDALVSSETPAGAQQEADETPSKRDEAQSIPGPNENEKPEVKDDKKNHPPCDPVFASRVVLSPIPDVDPLPLLSPRDIAELESALQIGDKYRNSDDNQWRDDWGGNLQLLDKELLMNRGQIAQDPQAKPVMLPFVEWVAKTTKDPQGFRGVRLLFSYVYHMQGTPPMAQKIMAYALQRPAQTVEERLKFIRDGIRRITYDPTVLNQDGWTTAKAESPDGVTGGAFLIGRRVIWHRYEAIVIAFVRDEEMGDLWKAIWLEDHDTFDLEADELQEALKKWERKEQLKQKKLANRQTLLGGTVKPQGFAGKVKVQSTSMRFAASSNFTIEGIEHGIILATSFNQQARLGVPWPARVMNVSEVKAVGAQSSRSRSSSKNNIHIVFLAPYWNGQYAFSSKKSGHISNKAATAKDPFSTGPLFEMDTIEVSESTIKKYPFDVNDDTLSIDKLRTNFRFLGLPGLAFDRYLAAHRLALAFKSYAIKEISRKPVSNNQAQAGALSALTSLTDAHTLSVRAHLFPQASLDLPFDYILSKLPCPIQHATGLADDAEETTEPVINLHAILKALSPPRCFGLETAAAGQNGGRPETPQSDRGLTPVKSPDPVFPSSTPASGEGQKGDDESLWSVSNFASDYLLKVIGSGVGNNESAAKLPYLGIHFAELVGTMRQETEAIKGLPTEERKGRLGAFLKQCLVIKGHGEDIIYSHRASDGLNVKNIALEWRKACERVYKRASVKCSHPGFGDGVTFVITDSRCNQHITANGSFERAVRLPAAIKGAKKAGAGKKETMPLLYTVDSKYMDLAEEQIIPKAHKASYLKRLKAKVANLPTDAKGVPLTDDSEGEGGEDTMGSRGSYTAAVLGVAAALQGVDKIVGGQCVNVFCAIRPPGHHAGRELRPMHAISNGFCLLNAAACAALYATAPQAEGGLGLKRVCVIDFDVHHGNGTQDILCSTQDSRFLYVSLHAGGAHINGYDSQGEAQDGHTGLGGGTNDGIFPGRCGDTSPHDGVLNIPLGQKVTAAAVGNALVTKVSPAVEKFCPELIVLSAGFDAHKHDPLGMGGLSAEDFGSVTEVACQMAFKTCSGRVISVLEGGYGVPCCRPPSDLFLPDNLKNPAAKAIPPPVRLLDLGEDLPDSMDDTVTPHLQQKLERCHQEGFVDCVQSHVGSLSKCSMRGK